MQHSQIDDGDVREGAPPATATRVPTQVIAYEDAQPRDDARPLAVETPVNLVYGSVPYAVMMTSPSDLEDFAYGFSLTEGIVEAAEEIRSARVEAGEGGLRLPFHFHPGATALVG